MNNSKIINVRLMKKVLVLVLSFLSVTAFAQNITVKGIVKDGTGEPIIGGSVLVKGSSIGTVTDVDGNYTLSNVPPKVACSFVVCPIVYLPPSFAYPLPSCFSSNLV